MELTERQKELLRAALTYAFSNIDDLNDAAAFDDDNEDVHWDGFSEEEVEALAKKFGIDIR